MAKLLQKKNNMKTISNPSRARWEKLTERPLIKQQKLMKTVDKMFYDIHRKGDKAVLLYSRKFDFPEQEIMLVSEEEINRSADYVSEQLKQAIDLAYKNIETFHKSQQPEIRKVETAPGVVCWSEARAIDSIGIYVPGGSAPLFSTVLMLAIPAKIAGCKEIVLCTPPNEEGKIHPAILYSAKRVGATKIFAIGGIQAIAAMTFGTQSVPKVNKIFGPGNQYVMAAKRSAQYYGVAIDMPAGPSELLVIADETCNPSFVAADLLSQAEHGPDSQVILLSNNKKIIKAINKELELQLVGLPRQDIASKALKNSRAIYLKNLDECIEFSNLYAPEHLILAVENPSLVSRNVNNAGSVFLGNWSSESAGDYASGTNHTLPTNGYSKSYSGVSLDSFIKKITFQELNEEGVLSIGNAVEAMAEAEQLFAHKNAITLRQGAIIAKRLQNSTAPETTTDKSNISSITDKSDFSHNSNL